MKLREVFIESDDDRQEWMFTPDDMSLILRALDCLIDGFKPMKSDIQKMKDLRDEIQAGGRGRLAKHPERF